MKNRGVLSWFKMGLREGLFGKRIPPSDFIRGSKFLY